MRPLAGWLAGCLTGLVRPPNQFPQALWTRLCTDIRGVCVCVHLHSSLLPQQPLLLLFRLLLLVEVEKEVAVGWLLLASPLPLSLPRSSSLLVQLLPQLTTCSTPASANCDNSGFIPRAYSCTQTKVRKRKSDNVNPEPTAQSGGTVAFGGRHSSTSSIRVYS
ncbi:hypothetical protein TcWFU_007107 [Taenia crassiceps]|uniref:Secreted protein n=1 Tax=Taenia crassiceps TaxID=6207 RepID=A0ABR4Q3L4_9CEST